MKMTGWLVAAAAFVAMSGTAFADTFYFNQITSNGGADVSGQLSVEVTNAGANQVAFTFNNVGTEASSITAVYFDDGTLLGIASITESSGVNFSQDADPPDLPAGNTVGFDTTAGFLADSDPPRQPNGVNNTATGTEWVTITFNLINGQTFADTIAALGDGRLNIGIHVQGYANGKSESFTTNPPVPEPGTMLLLGSGLLGLGLMRRRKVSKA